MSSLVSESDARRLSVKPGTFVRLPAIERFSRMLARQLQKDAWVTWCSASNWPFFLVINEFNQVQGVI